MKKEVQWLFEEKYGGRESEAFAADIQRLEAGEPLAYVIGHVPFLGTTIFLDSHPLIPRAETEFWVEKAISDIKTHPNDEHPMSVIRVLDLCAGSGCIGVAVAKAIPNALIDFCEIDERHHSTIRKNVETNEIDKSRVRIFGDDLFENISGTYDYVLSNPPYVDPKLDRTEPSVKNFEPHEALYGGESGLEIIERIIKEAPPHLAPGGTLYLEHEPEQSSGIQALATENGFAAKTKKDQYGVNRYSILKLLN